jgi:spore coat protein U-like protein
MRYSKRALLIAACLVVSATAHAASSTSPLEISAVVVANCQIITSDLAFGAYDPLMEHATRELDGAAQVTMLCTRSSRAEIIIDSGKNPIGTYRGLSGGTQHVSYQLYRDAGRTQVWGSAGNALQFVSKGVALPQQFVVYGRIPPGQEVASGVYTDVVTATVEF